METYTLGYKFRIYPNKTQENLINRTLGCARFVFNHFLAVRRDEWKANHNSLTYVKTSKLLTDLKKREETRWLSEADSMALQESLRNLDRAFQNFFAKRARCEITDSRSPFPIQAGASFSANLHTRRNCTGANCSRSIHSTRRVKHALFVAIRTH